MLGEKFWVGGKAVGWDERKSGLVVVVNFVVVE